MDTSNERPTRGACGAVGDPAMKSAEWRAQLQRKRIVNKIMDTMKKHLPFSGYERLQELKKIAERIEQEIHTAATSQSEYARKICFMMLTMETRLRNPMPDPMQSNYAAIRINPSVPINLIAQTDNSNGGDWQEEVYQKIKAMKELYLLESGEGKAQLQDSSSLSSALPPSNEPTLTNVGGQNLNMENTQNMSSVQRNQLIGQQYDGLVTQYLLLYQEHLREQRMLQQQMLRHTEGASAAFGDWRPQLPADTRERMVNKIIDNLKSHFPFSGQQELKIIAERIEEEHYTAATAQINAMKDLYLLDSTARTSNPNDEDVQEEVYQKVSAMKDLYLLDLNNLHQKVISTLQQQLQNEILEKLKAFKKMLEDYIQFLQMPKHGLADYKDRLGSYERQISSIVNANKRKPGSGQQQPQA